MHAKKKIQEPHIDWIKRYEMTPVHSFPCVRNRKHRELTQRATRRLDGAELIECLAVHVSSRVHDEGDDETYSERKGVEQKLWKELVWRKKTDHKDPRPKEANDKT